MKKIFYLILVLVVCGFTVSNAQILTVNEIVQEQTEWCWAGVSKCVLDYYGSMHDQCEIAEYARTVATWNDYGPTNCCTNPNNGCNYWNYNYGYNGSIEDILEHFASVHNYGYSAAITQYDIDAELSNGRPFIIRWGWYSGGGHFVVGHGKQDQTIYYMNPWYGEGLKFADYDWLVDDGVHQWTHTNILTTNPSGTSSMEVKPYNHLIISPNPSDGNIEILLDTKVNEEIQIEIYNANGQMISVDKYDGKDNGKDNSKKLKLSPNLSCGIYTVRAIGNSFVYSEKLVVY